MKRLFCTVVTDLNGTFESPIIYHIKAETMDHAEQCMREQLVEAGYDDETLDESFETFTFAVTEMDIIEA